ncbi:lytic transglycosylase domain-containing protein [Nitrobacter winogradskyi]|uniref:Soluble lytic murein transglycosylase-like protein n=2 Tax=Nitrobacter winogradskyi TaxID=913 RepID=A0ACC6AR95_NITWI|nr:lytic transglycosylase domain-containing protein [Nitrobacter winogradskyi]MCP2001420.1 soluble lytic murein transglycosylase-like protein [Nitrobacter winogradskyi]GEC15465.1 hypothetical protein NWI01_13570 [Nitrobacter winogradskyi]
MSIRILAIGVSILASAVAAQAQDATKPSRLATVDATGRVVPLKSASSPIERIDAAMAAVSPCTKTVAMAPDKARALVSRIAAEENFYPEFVQSVAKIESHFNSIAVSDKGAVGLMQLMPETAQRFRVDLCDPADNVRGGVRLLRTLHQKYQNPLFILAAYNAGEGAVDKVRGVPGYPETVRFVAQVLNDFYTWPLPGEIARRDRRSSKDERPDLIELGAVSAAPKASASPPGAPARWNDGFVMHVD